MIKFSRLGVLVDWRISDLSGREDFFFIFIYLFIFLSPSFPISHAGVGGWGQGRLFVVVPGDLSFLF